MRKDLGFLLSLLVFVTNCNETENILPEEEEEYGYLAIQVGIEIETLPAARVEEVNTDDFIVTIHKASDDSEVERFDPFSSAPAEVQLPTGEYYIRATNLDPPSNAAFEQPWYYGESTVFNIDKEELKTVDVTCTLANYKVSFVYSQNVLDNFTDWQASATLTNENVGLVWIKGNDSEGYFIGGPLDIVVSLAYTKVFTGELITREFSTTITDPQPATLYRINIDASLEDGKIVLNINVDDSFDVVDIDLGDGVEQQEEGNPTDIDGNVYETVQIGEQVWMKENLKVTQLNDGTPIPNAFGTDWVNSTGPAYGIFNNATTPTYGNLYNWQAVETGKLCPVGWHVPTVDDMQVLAQTLGGHNLAGGKLKAVNANWSSPNTGATNESGFTALSSGFRFAHSGSDAGLGTHAYFWSSTLRGDGNVDYFALYSSGSGMSIANWAPGPGASVRCLKD
jgi:uncharacterized protein (TIGR02145 family)